MRLLSALHLVANYVSVCTSTSIKTQLRRPNELYEAGEWFPPVAASVDPFLPMNRKEYLNLQRMYGRGHLQTAHGGFRCIFWRPHDSPKPRFWSNEKFIHESDHPEVSVIGGAVYSPGQTIFSPQGWVRDFAMSKSGLVASTAILALAAAGIDLIVPNVQIARLKQEELSRIREKLDEERQDYLQAISKLADEGFSRLSSQVYGDTISWARNESVFKLLPAAEKLKQSLFKLDQPLVKRVGARFLTDGVPAIGQALVERGIRGASAATAEEILKAFSSSWAKKIEERKLPQVSYCIKVSRMLQAPQGKKKS
jgi:hypothetical protein